MRSLATRQPATWRSAKHVLQDAIDVCTRGRLRPGHRRDLGHRAVGHGSPTTPTSAMYVMTAEYGAATQLEKIDMLDFADVIAINKFDKRGSQDALRDVRKQWQAQPPEASTPRMTSHARVRHHRLAVQRPGHQPLVPHAASTTLPRSTADSAQAPALDAWSVAEGEVSDASARSSDGAGPARARRATSPRSSRRADRYDRSRRRGRVPASPASAYQLRGACCRLTRQPLDADLGTRWHDGATATPTGPWWPRYERGDSDAIDRTSDAREVALLDELARQSLARSATPAEQYLAYTGPRQDVRAGRLYTRNTLAPADSPVALSHAQAARLGRHCCAGLLDRERARRVPLRSRRVPAQARGRRPHRACSPARAAPSAPIGVSTTCPRACPRSACPRPSTRSRSTARTRTRPDIYGKIGNSGVSIATLDDAKKLYSGFDLWPTRAPPSR